MAANTTRKRQDLNCQIAEVENDVQQRFETHRDAEIISSMAGIGNLLVAEFLAATGGDLTAFASPDRLAGCAAWRRCSATPASGPATSMNPYATTANCNGAPTPRL